jgi:GTP cyclohydrolase IA
LAREPKGGAPAGWKGLILKTHDRNEFAAGYRGPERAATPPRPTRAEAEAAVRTLLAWSGDDPAREGLAQTPQRVVDAFGEYFSGYGQDAVALLQEATLDDVGGYDDIVMLNGIDVLSHCEHHITPFTGKAWIAYIPDTKVTGLSRLIRVVETFARRLQTQEALTQQIAAAIETGLAPRGVAVLIEAEHQCVAARGVRQCGVGVATSRFLGCFATDASERARFLSMVRR